MMLLQIALIRFRKNKARILIDKIPRKLEAV